MPIDEDVDLAAIEAVIGTFEMPVQVRARAFLIVLKAAGIKLSAEEYKEFMENIQVQRDEYLVRRMEIDLRRVQLEKELASGEAGKKGLHVRTVEAPEDEEKTGEGA